MSRVRLAALAALAAGVLAVGPARAEIEPHCDPATTARLAALLDREARHAARWRWTWAAVFGAAAAGQLAVAAAGWVPDDARHDAREASLLLGAGKASIGLGVRLFLPPKVARPRLTGDACADERAVRAALARTARRERNSMALNVAGGLSLNLGTSLYLGVAEESWTDAGISFAMGTVVSVLSAVTQPRRVWRQAGVHADRPLVGDVRVAPWLSGRGLAIAGSF